MASDDVYLRPNAVIEPLFNQWYAWAYLLAPQSSAMFVANTHLKLMQSFGQSPQIHVNALKNPAMRGGPFLELPAERAPEVKALWEETLAALPHVVEFAEAVKTLDRILLEEAKGGPLEPLYAKVPEALKGYVELVYDQHDNASIRFFEGLLYKSRYWDPGRQSVCMHVINPDERSFVLSTPRLAEPGELFVKIPFSSESLDALYRMRYHAGSFEAVRAMLDVGDESAELFRSFFTTDVPKPRPTFEGTEPRIRYFGHATVLVEAPGVSILFDPIVSYNHESGPPRLSHADLPETIDYIVLTHNHQDHFLVETMLELRQRVRHVIIPRGVGGTLVDPSLKLILEHIGIKNVIELGDMESIPVEGGSITALPFIGEHSDLDIRTKAGWFVKVQGRGVMMMADANNFEPRMYDHVQAAMGDADVIFIGMECEGAPMSWLYGPLLLKQPIRKNDMARRLDGCDFPKASKLVERFHPKQVYVYALGQEPWLGHVASLIYTDASPAMVESNKLIEQCRSQGMTAERLYLTRDITF